MNLDINISSIIIVSCLVFFAGFVDSIAGGGGLISLPAYLVAGIPMHYALGTNKFASACGTSVSVIRFIKNKRIHIPSVAAAVTGALMGSSIGANIALRVDEKYLQYFLIVSIPIIFIVALKKKELGDEDTSEKWKKSTLVTISFFAGLIIGGYDGFYGPGTGTFLMLIFSAVIGFNVRTAVGNTKVVNFASNIAALATFLVNGKVFFPVAIPAAVFGILGNYVGSGLVLKNGAKVVRPIFIVVLVGLFIKILVEII